MVYSLLTAGGAYDRAAILREALGLHLRSRSTFWAGSFTLSYCLRGAWGRARRQQARHRTAREHDLLFDLLQESFRQPEMASLAERECLLLGPGPSDVDRAGASSRAGGIGKRRCGRAHDQ
jgi:hypothetical protein